MKRVVTVHTKSENVYYHTIADSRDVTSNDENNGVVTFKLDGGGVVAYPLVNIERFSLADAS